MEMAPSVARKVILEEHQQLRTKLEAIEALLKHSDYGPIKNAITEFYHYFTKHITTEETLIFPILREHDSWGPQRVENMTQEHRKQTQDVENIAKLVSQSKPTDFIPALEKFISELYKDIELEEKEFLNTQLLRDDLINLNIGS